MAEKNPLTPAEATARARADAMRRGSDPKSKLEGLKAELEGVEFRIKAPWTSDEQKAAYTERVKEIKAEISKFEKYAKSDTRLEPPENTKG